MEKKGEVKKGEEEEEPSKTVQPSKAVSSQSSLSSESDGPEEVVKQYKVVILGDGTVGKTSLCTRFCEDMFAKQYKQTIGLDFFVKKIEIQDGLNVAYQIWDIGGQSIGSKMISNYLYGAQAVVYVFDISNYQSFLNLEEWFKVSQAAIGPGAAPLLAVVANKADLEYLRAVKQDKMEEFAKKHKMRYFTLSAKTGDRIKNMFLQLGAALAGVELTESQLEATKQPIAAHISDFTRNDPNAPVIDLNSTDSNKKCNIL